MKASTESARKEWSREDDVASHERNGFTLIELLVVMATVAVLVVTLLPALAGTRSGSQTFQCLNNLNRLTAAWTMYASDYGDKLAGNPSGSPWVAGLIRWTTPNDNSNAAIMLDATMSSIANYVKSADLFKCPADNYQTPTSGRRVRSVSLNAALGGNPEIHTGIPGRTYNKATKMSDLSTPGPSMIFAILDEHPDSINDSVFHVVEGLGPGTEQIRDLPASHHNGGASVSFADGRAEVHKWKDSRSVWPVLYQDIGLGSYPGWSNGRLQVGVSVDYEWLDDRLPYR
jgi:prepilin-type N-terminal cleavage/methylation domain-containing protein/prepilin-type processing-associated H-X9-DG protein